MIRNNINIGLFGFGCVGIGLYEVLAKTPTLKAQIKTICVKNRSKNRVLPIERFVYDPSAILNDDSINVVVELIDDADAAYEIVKAAIKKGKALVTANKKMLAEHLQELISLQKTYNVSLLYEGACCASIPIIRNLEEYYDNDLLEEVEGIVNGSTNYILTQTSKNGWSYAQALAAAQQRGYAESNPIFDTGGYDARFKLVLLLAHAFGVVAKPTDIIKLGIDRIGAPELAYAKVNNWKIKLVAVARKNTNGSMVAFVMPKFITPQDHLFDVDDVYNGLKIKSCFSDTQFFSGKGAGSHPTASAVLSDISALSYDYKYAYKKIGGVKALADPNEVLLSVYFRYHVDYQGKYQQYFEAVHEVYQNKDFGYIIGDISLADVSIVAEEIGDFGSFTLFNIKENTHELDTDEPTTTNQVYELLTA